MNICEYGCGQEATHQFKNGKWCCCKSSSSCNHQKKKISIGNKKGRPKIIEDSKNLCFYGCGNIAKYQLKNGNWCCSETQSSCIIQRQKVGELHKGKPSGMLGKKQNSQSMKNGGLKRRGKPAIEKGRQIHSEEFKERQRQRLLNGHALKMIKAIKKISNEEIKLREMVQKLYPEVEHQHKVFNYSLDVALPDKKIAIEYDGYYHFDTEEHKEYHKFRQEKIEKEGWKFLRYSIFDIFPTLEKLKEDIDKII